MKTITLPALLLVSLSALAPVSLAGEGIDVYERPSTFEARIPPLKLGDPAPKLVADRWLGAAASATPLTESLRDSKAAPFPGFGKGKVTLVEHFASWCAPCRKSLPHVADLSKRYADRGLVVVGVASAETDQGAAIEKLVKEAKLPFPVAFRKSTDAYDSWVRAARGSGLPWVFIVDRDGRVAWWGQPFYEGFETALDAVLSGKPDPNRSRALPATSEGWKLREEADAALEKGDPATAVAKLDALVKIDSERWWWEVVEAASLRAKKVGDAAGARAAAQAAIDGVSKRNPHALTALAELVLSLPAPYRDAGLAMRAATRADTLTFGADAEVKRVLALAREASRKG